MPNTIPPTFIFHISKQNLVAIHTFIKPKEGETEVVWMCTSCGERALTGPFAVGPITGTLCGGVYPHRWWKAGGIRVA